MAVISLCGYVGANTGKIECDVRRGKPVVMLVGGASFVPSDYATTAAFKSALLGYLKQATGVTSKLYAFPAFEGAASNTEANKTATTGYGTTYILGEGRPAYTFDIVAGVNTEKNLRKFNGAKVPVFIFDDGGNIWGKLDASGKFTGTTAQVFTTGAGFNNGSDISTIKVNVNFDSASDFFDYAAFVNTDFNPSDLEGLLDGQLVELAASTTSSKKIGVNVKNASLGNDINLYGVYADPLAAVGLWTAKNLTTGGAIGVTAVVKDPVLEGWTVTLDATAYGAVPTGGQILINLATPGILDAAFVSGIEGAAVSVKK